MSVFVGTDGYGRFQIGWADNDDAKIWARLDRSNIQVLRGQIGKLLDQHEVEDDLRAARRRITELERSNAALRGVIARSKS